jgi:hypothetical protein
MIGAVSNNRNRLACRAALARGRTVMAGRTREIAFLLDARFAGRFNGTFAKARAVLDRTQRQLGGVAAAEDRASRSARRLQQANSGMLRGILGFAAGYLTLDGLRRGYEAVTKAADDQQRADSRLLQLAMKTPGMTLKQVKALQEQANALQKVTTVADEVNVWGASQLASYRLQHASLKKLMPVLTDFMVGQYGVNVSQEQAQQAATLLGKSLSGMPTALKRLGITLTKDQEKLLKFGDEAQRVATLTDLLNKKYGGLAQRLAQDPEGRKILLYNAWGEVLEKIGFRLYPRINKFITYLSTHLPQIEKMLDRVIDALEWTLDKIEKISGYVVRNWPRLKWILVTALGLIIAIKGAIGTMMAISAISAGIEAFRNLKNMIWGVKVAEDAATGSAARLAGASGLGAVATTLGKIASLLALPVFAWEYSKIAKKAITPTIKDGKWYLKGKALTPDMREGIAGFIKDPKEKARVMREMGIAVPKHAQGGLVTRPHMGLIGERGPEMIVPLSDRTRGPKLAAEAARMTGLGGDTYNITVHAPGGDARSIAAAVRQELQRIASHRERTAYGTA